MKTRVIPSFIQMDAEELEKLTTEVRETIAKEVKLDYKPARKFVESDLWSILNSRKTASWMIRRNKIW